MLTYFPKYFSTRGIYCYVITLVLVSLVFLDYVLPFAFVLFGIIPVLVFFEYSNQLTDKWLHFTPMIFTKKLFFTALIIRAVCVLIIYFYYMDATGSPFKFGTGDDTFYHDMGKLWCTYGFESTVAQFREYAEFSDRGYCWWMSFVYLLFGTHVLPARFLKCFIDAFSCVLIYNLGKRNFGDSVGRMAAVFCMLMPNMWYYCGVTLKETEMAFLAILFAERADLVLRSPKIKITGILLPAACILLMFTFRTALAAVMFAAFIAGLVLSSDKQLQMWKKILYTSIFAVWMVATVGVEMIEETQELWTARTENQSVGYEWRSQTNSFAKYATSAVFAPMIFTIPFSSMVATPGQENQMIMNGANFIKNIMSGFTVFAMLTLLFSGGWRKHVLPVALTAGYLVVLVFSNFAHSERFHFPILAFELMFAAYGVSLMKNKHKQWYTIWLVFIAVANIAWAWIKLSGRGLV